MDMKTVADNLERPVFLCGAARSGTTLLLSLLDGADELLALPGEQLAIHYFNLLSEADAATFFVRDYPFCADMRAVHDPDWRRQKARELEAAYGTSQNHSLEVDSRAFVAAYRDYLEACEIRPRTVLQAIAHAYVRASSLAAQETKFQRPVFKRPFDYEFAAVRLAAEFPEARFVHILRDPRTRYASVKRSLLRRRWLGRAVGLDLPLMRSAPWPTLDFVRGIACNTMASFLLAARNRDLLGDRYLVVKYEDLTADPTATMGKVAKLLEIPFTPALTRPTLGTEEFKGRSSYQDGFAGEVKHTADDRLKTYRGLTSPSERRMVALADKDASEVFGYAWEDDIAFAGRDLWRFLGPYKHEALTQYFRNRRDLLRWMPEFSQKAALQAQFEQMLLAWERGDSFPYN